MRAQESPEGKWGTITLNGAINPPSWGEVSVQMKRGREHFYAKDFDGGYIPAGEEVVIVQYLPPRSVIVARVREQKGE